jgi:competence protein ComEA
MFRTLLSLIVVATFATAHPHAVTVAQQNSGPRPAAKTAVTGAININTASATEMEALPGIGAKTAARIIEYRQKNGPFKKIEDLMNVRGIGEKNFLKLKTQITVAAQKAEAEGR